MISDLSDLPAVRVYLKRIGAEVRSMRTAAIRERVGRYSRDRTVIRLDGQGNVAVAPAEGENSADFKPTDTERHAIRIEATGAVWPELNLVNSIMNSPPELKSAAKDDVFEFRDSDGNIVMLQVRVETTRGKAYIPFTYWTDHKWRKIEPDGLLPLWGLDQLKDYQTVFIHEGAKAARAMRRMVEDQSPKGKAALAAHPWGEEMKHCAHIGWIGGAPNPHRTDWSPLAKHGVTRAYTVADNDQQGVDALPKIAKQLRRAPIANVAVRFDARFKSGFDLADPFPATMFKNGRYMGPPFGDCVEPATWATHARPAPPPSGRGRPQAPKVSLRSEFLNQWIMVIVGGKTMFVARHNPVRLWSEDEFNTLSRPFSDVPRLSDLFKLEGLSARAEALAYEPGEASRVLNLNGALSVNLYMPPRIRATPGDVAPFEHFLEHLIPVADDRWEVKRWIATFIACPGVKMRYGLLLASAMQGVGKTTLCEIMKRLVGEHNCSAPSARDVVESQFNSWIVRKRLVFVNEIYAGTDWTAYNKLKSYIADDTLLANEKHVPSYNVTNWAHFILCSNSPVALRVDPLDRRFLVPEVTEAKQLPEFWQRLHDWLAGGGYGIVRHWAESFVAKHPSHRVGPGEDAPDTGRKRQLIEDSRSPEERMVMSLAAAARERAATARQPIILVEHDVGAWLARDNGKGRPPHVVQGWLKAGGLHVTTNRLKVDGHNRNVAGTIDLKGKGWGELKLYRVRPDDLLEAEL